MSPSKVLTPKAIQKYRLEKKLSQQDLAFILGVGTTTVSRWESGHTQITGTAGIILRTLIAASYSSLTTELMFGSCYMIYQLLKDVFEPSNKTNYFGTRNI